MGDFKILILAYLIGHSPIESQQYFQLQGWFPTMEDCKKELLKTFCRTNLSPQKTQSIWIRIKQFPLTASGKVQKFSIKEQFLNGKYGEVL